MRVTCLHFLITKPRFLKAKRHAQHPIRGLTMVEVLVALVIMGIAFFLFSYFTRSLHSTSQNRQGTQAITLARSYMDMIRTSWMQDESYSDLIFPDDLIAPGGFPDLAITVKALDEGANATWECTYSRISSGDDYIFKMRKAVCDSYFDNDYNMRSVDITLKDIKSENVEPITLSSIITRPVVIGGDAP